MIGGQIILFAKGASRSFKNCCQLEQTTKGSLQYSVTLASLVKTGNCNKAGKKCLMEVLDSPSLFIQGWLLSQLIVKMCCGVCQQTFISLHFMLMQTFNKFNEKRLCEKQILKGKQGRGKDNKHCLYVPFCWFLVTNWDRPLWITAKMKPLRMFNVQCFRIHLEKESILKVCGKEIF